MKEVQQVIQDYLKTLSPARLGLDKDLEIKGLRQKQVQKPYFGYIAEINDKEFLCKVDWSRTSMYPLSKEFQKLKDLEKYNIAPKAYVFEPEVSKVPLLITENPKGKVLTPKEVPEHLEKIINATNKIASIPLSELKKTEGFKDYTTSCYKFPLTLLHEHAKQLQNYVSRYEKNDITEFLAKSMVEATKYLQERGDLFPGKPMGLINPSLHASNMVLTSDGEIELAEWDRSRIGDNAFHTYLLMKLNDFDHETQKRIIMANGGVGSNLYESMVTYHELGKPYSLLLSLKDYRLIRDKKQNEPGKLEKLEKGLTENLEDALDGELNAVSEKKRKELLKKSPRGLTKEKEYKPSLLKRVWDTVKESTLIKELLLGTTLLGVTAGAISYVGHQRDKHFDKFLDTYREATIAKDNYLLKPTPKNQEEVDNKKKAFKSLRKKLLLFNVTDYLENHGWKKVCYSTKIPTMKELVDTCYLGEIKEKFNLKGTDFFLTESGERGILPIEISRLKQRDIFINNVKYDSKPNEVVIDLTLLEDKAKKLEEKIGEYRRNDSRCRKLHPKCQVWKQAIFETVKEGPIQQNYIDTVIEAAKIHEPEHNHDPRRNYNEVQGEINAILKEVEDSETPFVFSRLLERENAQDDPIYSTASKQVLPCLRKHSKLRHDLNLIRLPRNKRKELGKKCRKILLR
ncbi:hypothetical protein ACFLZZ_03945 [Nanoarchaeota archaeon]